MKVTKKNQEAHLSSDVIPKNLIPSTASNGPTASGLLSLLIPFNLSKGVEYRLAGHLTRLLQEFYVESLSSTELTTRLNDLKCHFVDDDSDFLEETLQQVFVTIHGYFIAATQYTAASDRELFRLLASEKDYFLQDMLSSYGRYRTDRGGADHISDVVQRESNQRLQ